MVININDDSKTPQLVNTDQPYPPLRMPDYYKKIENIFIEILTKYKGTDPTLRSNILKLLITEQIKYTIDILNSLIQKERN